jgi:hypothetical protein
MESEPKKRGIWLWVLLGTALALGGAAWSLKGHFSTPVSTSDILEWTDEEAKNQAADLLNKTVLVKDFRVEVHQVQAKENFWLIAKHYKINIETVLAFNPELQSISADLNDPLLVPNMKGALHQVKAGETLDSIAEFYSPKPGLLKASDIRQANRIGWLGPKPMELLFIPGAKPRELSPELTEIYKKGNIFSAPLSGRYTSQMGTRIDPFTGDASFHNGVDIKADYNAIVGAAADGTVIFAGWNGGFGRCIKIDHHDGYVTLYGHLNSILVHVGQKVKRHQQIGKVGSSGRSTGPHLHFTVYYQGKVQNPLNFTWR